MSAPAVRVGVLGCASIALRRMLPAMQETRQIEIVAVASRDADRAVQFATRFGCAGVVGYDALLARDDVEAVYIPLPSGLHAHWAARALAAGKHVLSEKPLTGEQAVAEQLVQQARSQNLRLTENFMFLHHHQHRAVRDLLAAGRIGRLQVFSASFGIPQLPAQDVRYNPSLGGGALLDVGVYPLRAASYFLGGSLQVLGAVLRRDPVTGVDVAGHVLLTTPEGISAELSFGFEHAYRSGYSLWGSSGRLSLDRAFTPPPDLKPVIRLEQPAQTEELTLEPDHQFRNIAQSFAASVRQGTDPDGCGEDLIAQARLIEQVQRQAQMVDA
ncbi:Gfo/Idh/MocA family protein [Kineosporia babensis]|uniref:Gfo/Idh/MocA family oxidoreductase n=1 Tax=Kineosporia babensis TaxID=499548 RepID=A0A9X1NL52_9ACTN|nr:Gfo/Idh/MocA family oxidoreductase [Kineosporia babensis]MCD5315721.1 Gfo/Idh/MocA family oxidoreductase [Kineosporia babensis]